MVGKIALGLVAFVLILACIFSFDNAFDYTYRSSGDYVMVDVDTPTKINTQLMDYAIDHTFGFIDDVGTWLRGVWNRGLNLFGYMTGNFDYVSESTMRVESFDAYNAGIKLLQDDLYALYISQIEADGGLLVGWRRKRAHSIVYGDDFCLINYVVNTDSELSFFADCHPFDYGEDSYYTVEVWSKYTGIAVEALHAKFAAAGLSHYYGGTYYKYMIDCPPIVYGPSAPV